MNGHWMQDLMESVRVSDSLAIRCINNATKSAVMSAQVYAQELSPTPRIHIEFDNIELPSRLAMSLLKNLILSLNSGTTFGVRTRPH